MSRARSRCLLAITILGAIVFGGCGGSDDNGGTTTLTPAISIALSASSLSVVQGTAGNITVNLTRTGGFSGDVSIAVTGLPTGATVSSATIASGAASATLTFAVAATTATGASTVTINATGTGVTTASATLALTVTAAAVTGNYTLTASPAAPSIAQGGAATVVITVNRTGGFAGAVALSVTGAANGLTAALSTPSTTGTTDTLTLTASATATVGAQTLTVKGTVAGLTDQTVTVQASVTAQTTSGNVTWQFCGRLGIPILVAFQDGTRARGARHGYERLVHVQHHSGGRRRRLRASVLHWRFRSRSLLWIESRFAGASQRGVQRCGRRGQDGHGAGGRNEHR